MFELSPWRKDRSVWNYFDDLERAFFQSAGSGTSQMRTDIVDEGDHFLLSAELPGFVREDIKIDVDNGYLTIRAQRGEEKEEKEGNYIRRERRYGAFARSFDLAGIDTDHIAAKYENGILSLQLPKQAVEPVPPTRQIEIQ